MTHIRLPAATAPARSSRPCSAAPNASRSERSASSREPQLRLDESLEDHDLGEGRWVAQPARLRSHFGEPVERGLVVAGQLLGLGRRQPVLEFGERGPGRLVLGKRQLLHQRRRVGARLRNVEAEHGIERRVREVAAARLEQDQQVVGLAQTAAQTGHLAVEQRLGLFAPDPRRHARLVVDRRPPVGVVVEPRCDRLHRLAAQAPGHARQMCLELGPAPRVPDLRHVGIAGSAQLPAIDGEGDDADGDRRDRHAGRGGEPTFRRCTGSWRRVSSSAFIDGNRSCGDRLRPFMMASTTRAGTWWSPKGARASSEAIWAANSGIEDDVPRGCRPKRAT